MKHKIARAAAVVAIASGLVVSGAATANAASQSIYDGKWEYGVSSTVNWTQFTPYHCPSLLRNLVLQNGGSVYRYFSYDDNPKYVSRARHATENYQGINW